MFLDETASLPTEVVAHHPSVLDCRPEEVRAEDFGWVCLRRLLWVNVGVCTLPDLSTDCFPQGAVLVKQPDRDRLIWNGALMLAQVRSLDGYVSCRSFLSAMWRTGGDVYVSSSRSRCNPCTEADRRVLHRFNHDGQQHPIMTFSEHSLAWMADKWRNPTAREKAVIIGYPLLQWDYRLPRNQLVALTINVLRWRQRLSVEVSIYHW